MSDLSEIPRNIGPGDQVVSEEETYGMPEGAEVYRVDEETGIKVYTDRVVNVQPVGGALTGIRTFSVNTTVPQRILNRDLKRGSWTIIPIDNDIILGNSQEISSGVGTLLPAGVPLNMATTDEIWAMADVSTAQVSVFFEQWAR